MTCDHVPDTRARVGRSLPSARTDAHFPVGRPIVARLATPSQVPEFAGAASSDCRSRPQPSADSPFDQVSAAGAADHWFRCRAM